MIDLHTHSTASDGTLTPSQLVRYAVERSIEVLSLTDHDTLSGLAEAGREAEEVGLEFIPGVEISAEFSPGTLHILGYFVDPDDSRLEQRLAWLREGRDNRNEVILGKLADLGFPVEMEEVIRFAGGETVGRPHIADAMANRGYVASRDEAFDRFLAKGAPAYADKERMTHQDAISVIRQSGGIPVLAHPQYLGLNDVELTAFVAALKDEGLEGIEVYYYSHAPGTTRLYRSLAQRFGLLQAGGTDFHGPDGLKGTDIGVGRGDMSVPREVSDRLTEAWKSRQDR